MTCLVVDSSEVLAVESGGEEGPSGGEEGPHPPLFCARLGGGENSILESGCPSRAYRAGSPLHPNEVCHLLPLLTNYCRKSC